MCPGVCSTTKSRPGDAHDVAADDRAQVLHRSERVVEAGAPRELVGERHGVRLVHVEGRLAGEVAGLTRVVDVGVGREHGDQGLAGRGEHLVQDPG